MISKLIEESGSSSVLFSNLNSDILDHFVRLHDRQITVEVNDLKTISQFKKRKVSATVLHLESFMDFEEFFSSIRSEVFLYDGHFIIIYDTAEEQELEKIFSKFWKAYIFNVNVLVTNGSVFTYMPFANGLCDNTKAVRINELNKTSMNWTTNVFFPKKFKQMNRCLLRFGGYDDQPPLIIIDIGTMLGDKMNFTLNIIKDEQEFGVIYKNKTATALLKRIIDNDVDLCFSFLHAGLAEALSATRKIYYDKLILVVPPPFLIDPMKKIMLPFTFASWQRL